MTVIASGASATFGVHGDQVVTLDTSPGTEGYIVLNDGPGAIQDHFGPMPMVGKQVAMQGRSGRLTITSKNGAVTYSVSTSVVGVDPANAAITGGTIGGAPISGGVPIVSGSVRCNVPTVTAVATASAFVFRSADFSVVQCDNPVIELWNGYCIGDGTHTQVAEQPTGAALSVRYALLTGGSGGVTANQTGATVWKATFYGMLSDPEFKAAGGTVSTDGQTVTVPDGLRFRTDPIAGLRLSPLTRYYHQLEEVYQAGQLRISGDNGSGATLGDYRWNQSTNAGSPVYSTDWSVSFGGTTPILITGSSKMPLAVFGTGDGGPRSKLVAVEGDSIFANGNNVYLGQFGERSALKTALVTAGYSFVSPASAGSNMGDMKTFGGWRVRMGLLKNAYAVITDHGHNDRGTAVGTFAAVAFPIFQWHTGMLRAFAKPGAKIIRSTLAPHTSSSDTWLTLVNQSYQTAADNPSTGWVAGYLDYLRRTGTFAGTAFSGLQDPDGMWDMVTDLGAAADLKWPVDGVTANYGTADGTHPSALLTAKAAAALIPKLSALIGF